MIYCVYRPIEGVHNPWSACNLFIVIPFHAVESSYLISENSLANDVFIWKCLSLSENVYLSEDLGRASPLNT
jgi:hypothetical protein